MLKGFFDSILRGYCFGPFGSVDLLLHLLWFSRSNTTFALVRSILFSTSIWLRRSISSSCLSFLCVISFLRFWVQGGHSFEPIYWPFVGGHVDAVSLTFTRTLVSCSSCLPRLLWREVLRDYPAAEGVGYQEVEGVRAGVAVLNPEYQHAHNQENQFYVGASCRFGPTHRSEIRKVQGYHYLCALGRGSNLLLPPWFASKA